MSLPAPVPVKVNFNVVIDADNKVQLFGEPVPTPTNVIVAERKLPVVALYDETAKKGLLEFWEPADAQGDLKCQLANSDTSATGGPNLTGAYQVAAKRLAAGLETILCDKFDCSGAVPFNNYAANVEYYKQRDFGRIALGMMAHYLFGHVDATAAITNDKAFVQSMLSISAGGDDETAGGAAARAAAFTKSTTADLESWNYAASSNDANLALRLVQAIVKKGKAGADITSPTLVQSSVSAITSTATDQTLANIVKQVIGQDSSRTQNADGSARSREQHLLLRFYPGDVIYMNITVKKPTVEVTGYSAGANAPANTLVTEQSYVLKITLSSEGLPTYTPDMAPGLALWLDAADASTFTLSGANNAVSAWRDKSGNGRHGVNMYGTVQRQLNTFNGYPSVYFNVGAVSSADNSFTGTDTNTTITVFNVYRFPRGTGQQVTRHLQMGGIQMMVNGEGYAAAGAVRTISSSWESSTAIGVGASNTNMMLYAQQAPALNTMILNGNEAAKATGGTGRGAGYNVNGRWYIGLGGSTNAEMNGNVAEMLVYIGAMTTLQRQKIEAYLAHKWGLAASLPVSHPYKDAAPSIMG